MSSRAGIRVALAVTLALGASAAFAMPTRADPPRPPAKLQFSVTLMWTGTERGIDHWELDVENTNTVKFINTFGWVPPDGLNVTAITHSEGGKCLLIVDGSIKCAGNIPPEPCSTCEGGTLTVQFTGNGFAPIWMKTDDGGGYWFSQGWTPGAVTVTSTSAFADLPFCAKGQVSTKRRPCAKR